jgi:hypothetical protein
MFFQHNQKFLQQIFENKKSPGFYAGATLPKKSEKPWSLDQGFIANYLFTEIFDRKNYNIFSHNVNAFLLNCVKNIYLSVIIRFVLF